MSDLVQVRIVCTDVSHEGRTVKVTTFQHDPLTDEAWSELTPYRLVDGEYLPRPVDPEKFQRDIRDEEPPQGVRHHQNLMCGLCGLKVSVRMSTLDPLLERLKDAGVTSVELRHLAGIVA